MSLSKKAMVAVKVFREKGVRGIVLFLAGKSAIIAYFSAKLKWDVDIESEVEFWDLYFSTRGLHWKEVYLMKLDPNSSLQARPASLLPARDVVNILDVGAGPLTHLGKKCAGKCINITAVDPLAEEYAKLLQKHGVTPIVKTQKVCGEELSKYFNPGTFDFVYARNSIDHSYDPVEVICQMIKVVKPGCFILLEHRLNEAINEGYRGLHQWNLSVSVLGDFIISSKRKDVNVTQKYAGSCVVSCEVETVEGDLPWLITVIQKK